MTDVQVDHADAPSGQLVWPTPSDWSRLKLAFFHRRLFSSCILRADCTNAC